MPGSSSWMPHAPQGVKGFDDYDDDDDDETFTKILRTDITFNISCMEASDFLVCFQLFFRQKFWAHDVRCT